MCKVQDKLNEALRKRGIVWGQKAFGQIRGCVIKKAQQASRHQAGRAEANSKFKILNSKL